MIKTIYDVIINKKLYHKHQNTTSTTNFILCKSCFWCASLLNNRSFHVCPSCMKAELESIPVSLHEIYKFDYDASRGVTLEFEAIK